MRPSSSPVRAPLPLLVLCLLAACAPKPTTLAQVEFARPVAAAKRFYVERHPGDERNYAALIRDELAAHGVAATSGPPAAHPPDTDILVRYVDRFVWSFRTFLASLMVLLYDAESEELLAAGRADSVSRRAPPEVVIREAVGSLFPAVPQESAAPP